MAKQKWANDNLQNITRKTKERPLLKSGGKQSFSTHLVIFLSLLVLLYFSLWPLCCLLFVDSRILIIPLVSSSSSYKADDKS